MGFKHEEDPFIKESFNRVSAKMADEKNVFRKVAKLTVYELIRYTPMNIRGNRLKNCRVYFYNSEYIKKEGQRGIRIFAYKTGCNRKTYMTQIGFMDYTKNLKSPVWVSCQCDYYKFQLEYANTQYGASDHVYAWQQPPVKTNPEMVPGACKHILALIDDALKRTRQFARLDKNKDLELEDSKIDKRWDVSKDPEYIKKLKNMKKLPNGKSMEDNPEDNELVMKDYQPSEVTPETFFNNEPNNNNEQPESEE